jgi:hypothetical protein
MAGQGPNPLAALIRHIDERINERLDGLVINGANVRGAVPVSSLAAHAFWGAKHTDVDSTDTPGDGEVVTWDAASGKWVASAPAGGSLETVDIASDDALVQAVNFEDQGSDPTAPATGHTDIYTKSGKVYKRAAGGAAILLVDNPMTAEDDLIVGGASGAPSHLAKGSDGQVLTVDPTTHHLIWAAPVGGGAITIREVDASPSVTATVLELPNGTLSDQGSGVARYTPAGGAGGNATTTSAYASPPSTPATGDLWLPNNGSSLYRYSGAAQAPWGPIFPLTPPPAVSTLTWLNQGSATVDETNGGFYLYAPAAAGNNVKGLMIAAPAAPYTFTIAMLFHGHSVQYNAAGIVLQQDDGKLVVFHYGGTPTPALGDEKYSSATSWSGGYTSVACFSQQMVWLRINDNNTNRTFYWSVDGQHFIQFDQQTRTDYITPTHIGVYVESNNGTYPCGATFLSWAVT